MRERLRGGAPYIAIVVVLGVGILAMLLIGALRSNEGVAGYAHMRFTPTGCYLDTANSSNTLACARAGAGLYVVSFSRSLKGHTSVGTRDACCRGPITTTINSDRTVLVSVGPKAHYPVVASVLIP